MKAAGLHLQAAHAGDVVAIGNLADYYEDLVPLALRGDLDASRALHQVYRDRYGPSPDAAPAWAWMRWAHDGCLPQRVAPRGDDTGEAIARDYAAALQATAASTRRAGDAFLGRLLAENGINVTGNWQPLLECGAVGGSVTLLGRWAPDGWRYRRGDRP